MENYPTYEYQPLKFSMRSMCDGPSFEDCVYLDWFLRTLLTPIAKDVTSHFPQTKEAALQTALRYDLIYAQSSYVYTIIPNIPHPGAANSLGASHATDGIIGDISHPSPYAQQSYGYPQGAAVPLTLMPLLPATCIQDKEPLTHLPNHISRCQGQIVLNLSTRSLPLHHLIHMHCQELQPLRHQRRSLPCILSPSSHHPLRVKCFHIRV